MFPSTCWIERSGEAAAQSASPFSAHRRQATRRRRGCSVAAAVTPAPTRVAGRPTTSNRRPSAPAPRSCRTADAGRRSFRVARSARLCLRAARRRRSLTASISRMDFSLAAFGVGLEHDLRAGIGAGDALQVDRHLLLPREPLVGQLRDVGQRLADRHQLVRRVSCCRHPSRPSPT